MTHSFSTGMRGALSALEVKTLDLIGTIGQYAP